MHVQACGRTNCIVSCSSSSKSKPKCLSQHAFSPFPLFVTIFWFGVSSDPIPSSVYSSITDEIQGLPSTRQGLHPCIPTPSFNLNTDSATVDPNLMSYGKSLACKAFESNSLLVLISLLLCSLRDLSYFSKRNVIRKMYVQKFLVFLLLILLVSVKNSNVILVA